MNGNDSIDTTQQEIQKTIAGEQPLMTEPNDPWATLPRGFHVGDRWETAVVVRELTGADEEAIAPYRQDLVLLIDTVLGYGVESIGEDRLSERPFAERTDTLRQLLVGERAQLFLAVARATFGDSKDLNYTCGHCQHANELTISLSKDIPIKEVSNLQQETHKFTTKTGQEIEYRLPTGADEFDLNGRKLGLNDSEQNTLLLTEIIVTVDGKPVVDKRAFARSLGMKDRALLISELIDRQPSPDMILNTECTACGESVVLPLTWELVFRP